MAKQFDKEYWESHWQEAGKRTDWRNVASQPYLESELTSLERGTALDAGCGEGAEAIWLASRGWQVTAVDISAAALSRAQRSAEENLITSVRWIEADLSDWQPDTPFDLVMCNYAHPDMAQLAFYERISNWVAPGGTLQIVGHRHASQSPDSDYDQDHHHGGNPPEAVMVTAASISELLDINQWDIVTADEPARVVFTNAGHSVQLSDVVVRAIRRTHPINLPSALFSRGPSKEKP